MKYSYIKTVRYLQGFLLFLFCGCSTFLFADPATIQRGQLVVPRVDFSDLGPVEIRFNIDTGDGVTLVTDSYIDAAPGVEVSGIFEESTGSLEIFEVLLPNGKRFYTKLEMVSPDDNERFQLTEFARLKDPANETDPPGGNADHDALGDFYDASCANCHGGTGLGTAVAPSLISCANCNSFIQLSDYIRDTMPLGDTGSCDEVCADGMAEFILSVLNAPSQTIKSIDGIILMSETEVLRKATMQLLNRLPTPNEITLVRENPVNGLKNAIDGMMEEEAFLDRVGEIFNLYLLTNKYLSSNSSEGAVRLLNRDDFPDARWFDPEGVERKEDYELIRNTTNNAVAMEPLELIKHVIRNDRPMSEILTADYIMLNPFSAKSYGMKDLRFNNPEDPNEFIQARLPGIPHAGILTSAMFLNRYPSTFTNRNRGRARVIFDYFLDTDILAIEGTRPGNAVDIATAIPTIDNQECSKCHSVIDPVASTFQNWNDRGAYRPSRLSRYGWFTDMETRGFAGKIMPMRGNADSSLQWLAGEIVKDPRFGRAMVRIMIRGLTGKEPLLSPGEDAPVKEQQAYLSERAILTEIQLAFEADNMNLKTLVREILLSPYWQAKGLTGEADALLHNETGSLSLIGPEQLNSKLEAVTGIEWRGSLDNYHRNIDRYWEARLLNKQYFQQIYGGIDSDNVVKPLTDPNGLMGAVQFRMANEMACYSVPNEFLNQKLGKGADNIMFPFVTMDTLPLDENGNPDSNAMQEIRKNIRYLHALFLGEERSFDDPEFAFTEDLFLDVFQTGQIEIAATEKNWEVIRLPSSCKRHRDLVTGDELRDEANDIDNRLMEDPDYIIRSWMAVVAYLMADYRFVYE